MKMTRTANVNIEWISNGVEDIFCGSGHWDVKKIDKKWKYMQARQVQPKKRHGRTILSSNPIRPISTAYLLITLRDNKLKLDTF